MIENNVAYSALIARDPRFDGIFFVGVTSTGVYCRPICPAKTPKPVNCCFFESAEAAEKASFRPCLRCRPELAPGNAPVDDAQRITNMLINSIEEGMVDDGINLEEIARQFELSSRQLRRIVQKKLGVSPIELIQTRRLLLAKQLLTETKLSITEVAFASGFSSLRRFNDAFSKRYRMTPSRLRKGTIEHESIISSASTSILQLTYRPPYDWQGILEFLRARMVEGVEWITKDSYFRTVQLNQHKGWVVVKHAPQKNALLVEFTHSLISVLPALLGRLRDLFDLSARPDLIVEHLKKDKLLKAAVISSPGLRVPGAFDGFELAIRAILGQQVTVKAATTLTCRFVSAFSEKIETPFAELNRLSPLPTCITRVSIDDIAKLGIVRTRAKSIMALAKAYMIGNLQLNVKINPDIFIEQLVAIPGIGQWTAHYIAMRALHWPDAFPKEDIAVRNNLGGITAKQAEEMSQAWRPWRSYAVFHIWRERISMRSAI